MADPFTMAVIGMTASAGSSLLGAAGAMQEGQSKSAMYGYQAGVARVNAEIAKKNADYALATGETRAMIQGMKGRAEHGQLIARMGASGVAVGHGSSKDVLESHTKLTNLDQGIIRNNAAREAYGYEVRAASETAQSGMYTSAAADASNAGSMKAFGSIIGGISSVSDKWMAGRSSGAINSSNWSS